MESSLLAEVAVSERSKVTIFIGVTGRERMNRFKLQKITQSLILLVDDDLCRYLRRIFHVCLHTKCLLLDW